MLKKEKQSLVDLDTDFLLYLLKTTSDYRELVKRELLRGIDDV